MTGRVGATATDRNDDEACPIFQYEGGRVGLFLTLAGENTREQKRHGSRGNHGIKGIDTATFAVIAAAAAAAAVASSQATARRGRTRRRH